MLTEKKSSISGKKGEIPKLIMTQMPHAGANDGMYEVIIPLEYVLAALKAPAAFFVFKFKGLVYEQTNNLSK